MDKVYMYFKKDNEDILMGKPLSFDGNVDLIDVVKISMMPSERGAAPYPHYYPNAFIGSMVNNDYLNKLKVSINIDDYVVVSEEDIEEGMLDLYKKVIKKRNNVPEIDVVKTMPDIQQGKPNLRLV